MKSFKYAFYVFQYFGPAKLCLIKDIYVCMHDCHAAVCVCVCVSAQHKNVTFRLRSRSSQSIF